MAETLIKTQLRQWIATKASIGEDSLNDSSDFIGDGMLASVDVLELIFLIEELSGQEVDVSEVKPEQFGSINAVYSAFFESA